MILAILIFAGLAALFILCLCRISGRADAQSRREHLRIDPFADETITRGGL